jgi:hypothetical protein
MTFLNWTILFGLAAVAIPILIHLLNRRRAKAVQWGAMRFLLASVASRNQRILLEELLLMILRCLTVALLVLAMARPYLPSRSSFSVVIVLPAVLLAAILAGAGSVLRSRRKLRLGLWTAAALLAVAAGLASAYEQRIQDRLWQGGGEKDVAIVIDASSSMTLSVGGTMNFQRALNEARAVIETCKPGDAISLVLAGPIPRALVASPSYDRKDLQTALAEASPVGGSMNAPDAITLAAATLEAGHNIGKKIVLITDSQSAGWDVASASRWGSLQATMRDVTQKPDLVVRTLAMPAALRNLALTDLRPMRQVIGTDRAVRIEAKVANTGTAPMEGASVQLLVDGLEVSKQALTPIPPNGGENVQFEHRFDRGGYHVLTARLVRSKVSPGPPAALEDDLGFDNQAQHVLYVMDRLPVLLVEGSPSPRPLEGAAEFLAVAMSPQSSEATPSAPAATTSPAGFLIDPKVILAPDIVDIQDFSPYRAVILANVAKLNTATANVLARYVQAGGGLWIAPGDKADPNFYNNWSDPAGLHVSPATLGVQRVLPPQGMSLATKTFNHPVLELLATAGQSDASAALLRAYWPLATQAKDPTVRLAGLLQDGSPLLVERKIGKGCVLMTAMSMDSRDCNLPALSCFLPLVHEAVYYLCAAGLPNPNVPPGAETALNLPLDSTLGLAHLAPGTVLNVDGPSSQRKMATVLACDGKSLQASFRGADQPGLYTIAMPGATDKAPPLKLPFVVLNDPQESRLASLTEADFARVGKCLPTLHAQTTAELLSAISGTVPGREIWRMLALAALAGLILEIAFTRWIAHQRRNQKVAEVSFGTVAIKVQDNPRIAQMTRKKKAITDEVAVK